ncbi:hypothetical protein phytr_5480 [Candidatus Phycorickettsia trachydisci]|uniref:Uncharacterized protein n=1 Tax=Candidatus Phycorickettsia trachydisci TaxID=2115978 RepID=A0A2P1P898_9RICK|nr:hypothetical protein [Candidatus Phycorickettsia trachydisci]AVP87493.1 hypothetical protein phytr_5480 [Candidatus Phycorickettsia trachydisci]
MDNLGSLVPGLRSVIYCHGLVCVRPFLDELIQGKEGPESKTLKTIHGALLSILGAEGVRECLNNLHSSPSTFDNTGLLLINSSYMLVGVYYVVSNIRDEHKAPVQAQPYFIEASEISQSREISGEIPQAIAEAIEVTSS